MQTGAAAGMERVTAFGGQPTAVAAGGRSDSEALHSPKSRPPIFLLTFFLRFNLFHWKSDIQSLLSGQFNGLGSPFGSKFG